LNIGITHWSSRRGHAHNVPEDELDEHRPWVQTSRRTKHPPLLGQEAEHMSGIEMRKFSTLKTIVLTQMSDSQRNELRSLLDTGTKKLITEEVAVASLKNALEAQANYQWAVMGVLIAAAGIVTAALSTNGPNTKEVIQRINSDLKTQLYQLRDALREADAFQSEYFSFPITDLEPTLPIWRELCQAADSYIDEKGTEAAHRKLRKVAAGYNRALHPLGTPSSLRGARNPNSVASKLLKRIDEKIYDKYKSGAGYEKTALDVANEFRDEKDEEAAAYIDCRKNKQQFARDAIKREKQRRQLGKLNKLVCVE
jgi:hypothetical protein